jgi:hypothetical protein
MHGDADGGTFPGSQGAANLVEWIDRVLLDLRQGRVNDARALLESQEWRSMDLSGIPGPIRNQMQESLEQAAQALGYDGGAAESAEEALLIARARFMPGG